jgi:hypothetical protein
VVDGAADLKGAVVRGEREVAADVVEFGGGDVPDQGFGGASALYGAGLIISRAARTDSRSSATVMARVPFAWS